MAMVLNDAELATLAQSKLFRNVDPARLRERLKPSGEVGLRPGAVLLELGQRNTVIYLLVSGRLAVYLDADASIPVGYVNPGECVGEISIIDDEAASASVVAVEPSRLLMTNPAHLWELMAQEHEVALNLMHILADRIRRNNAAVLDSLRQQAQLKAITTIDPLTGLHNRRWMNEVFIRQIDRCARQGKPVCLAVIDIDHFKMVNDSFGHLGGDQVLMQTARVLQKQFRPGDLIARYGGEEFCVLLPETALEPAIAAVERFRLAMERTVTSAAQRTTIQVTISAGVAQWRSDWSFDDLIEAADKALYRAKDGGRNQVVAAEAV